MQMFDVMIVLGRVNEYGALTKDAHERIRYAAELYHLGMTHRVIAPAKYSYKLTEPPKITEATMIKNGLLAHGVPESSILLEEKSCDTLGAAYFLKVDYVIKHNWNRILVVTSADHLERTCYVFYKVFGPSYDIHFTYGNRVLSTTEYHSSLEREKKSLQLMESTWVGPVKPGAHTMVQDIFKQHPGYNKKAKVSAQEIEERVQSQQITV